MRPRPPAALEGLWELAMNLRWTWDEATQDIFHTIDPQTWDAGRRDPLLIIARAGATRLNALASDKGFVGRVEEVRAQLRSALEEPRWFQHRTDTPLRSVAYFSPEFGIAEAIPQYSGGLGVLAGDHLRGASDLGLPLVGVGLLYRHGYFRQELDDGGWQREHYPTLDPHGMAMTPVEDVRVRVELGDDVAVVRPWLCRVGSVRLYLLDADIDENTPEIRDVTDRLYGGGPEHRVRQELLLGVGGVRALDALGEPVQVFHMNEGHAGFLALERIRRLVTEDGLSFDEALETVRAATVFTTHTSVPAGIDRFPPELMEHYFARMAEECGIPFSRLLALGQAPGEPADAPFNMAVLGFRLAGAANGVSRLHGAVSRDLFGGLWPRLRREEVPIGSVTNGVHARAWAAPAADALLGSHVGGDWPWCEAERWSGLDHASDEELWSMRQQGREQMVAFIRRRLRARARAHGSHLADLAWCEEVFDPRALTIGFARRFAGYKRATLLLSQPDRLRALLLSETRPLQLVYAGKAHPADEWGKEMIRAISTFANEADVRHRLVFLEDYDIGVARMLYQGADVWLNTPRRPHEACGTSGMKAVLGGALNCSVLDGWWDELYDGTNGWAIPSAEMHLDETVRDRAEADALLDLLEGGIVPLFYDRDENDLPRGWLTRIRSSLRTLGPRVTASRMVRDYTEGYYEPAARHTDALQADDAKRARALAAWKRRVGDAWDAVAVRVEPLGSGTAEVGDVFTVHATVTLGTLSPEDMEVQILHGPVDDYDEIEDPKLALMAPSTEATGTVPYAGSFTCEVGGRYGVAVRVVPTHPDLAAPTELGLVAWAPEAGS